MDSKQIHAEEPCASADTIQESNNEEITESHIGGGEDISNKEDMEMPREEWESLAALLREAYPSPETGKIAGDVMAQIRAEKTRKQKLRSLWRRYGSVAACLVLLCGTLLLVYPHLKNTVVMTADNATMATFAGNGGTETEAAVEMAVTEEDVEVYRDADEAVGFAMPRTAAVTEEAEEEVETEADAKSEAGAVQTYSATSLLKSVSVYAEEDTSADAADDCSLADGFLHYLFVEGYLTNEEYQDWLAARDVETVWEPEELCEAFGLDASLYDVWLRK